MGHLNSTVRMNLLHLVQASATKMWYDYERNAIVSIPPTIAVA